MCNFWSLGAEKLQNKQTDTQFSSPFKDVLANVLMTTYQITHPTIQSNIKAKE